LGFYYDHKEEVDRDIARRLEKVEEIKARWVDSPLAKKLKALKYPS
jgi:hypothetical protein